MKVTVTTLSDYIFVLDVSEDLELENFKAFCEVEAGIPAHDIVISFNGRLLKDEKKSLKMFGIKDGDVVILQQIVQSGSQTGLTPLDFSNIQVPSSSSHRTQSPINYGGDPAMIRNMLLANPEELAVLKRNNPKLVEAMLGGNLACKDKNSTKALYCSSATQPGPTLQIILEAQRPSTEDSACSLLALTSQTIDKTQSCATERKCKMSGFRGEYPSSATESNARISSEPPKNVDSTQPKLATDQREQPPVEVVLIDSDSSSLSDIPTPPKRARKTKPNLTRKRRNPQAMDSGSSSSSVIETPPENGKVYQPELAGGLRGKPSMENNMPSETLKATIVGNSAIKLLEQESPQGVLNSNLQANLTKKLPNGAVEHSSAPAPDGSSFTGPPIEANIIQEDFDGKHRKQQPLIVSLPGTSKSTKAMQSNSGVRHHGQGPLEVVFLGSSSEKKDSKRTESSRNRVVSNPINKAEGILPKRFMERQDWHIMETARGDSSKSSILKKKQLVDLSAVTNILTDVDPNFIQRKWLESEENIETFNEAILDCFHSDNYERIAGSSKGSTSANPMDVTLECECCFETVPIDDVVECMKEVHTMCKSCVIKSCEVKVGNNDYVINCLTDCKEHIPITTLERVLPPKLFKVIQEQQQMSEIKTAGLVGLETCPFCEYAYVPPKRSKFFVCVKEGCLKKSCRLCHKKAHEPLRCNEVDTVKGPLQKIEEAMTETLLRQCNSCGKNFIKEYGCNKIMCKCGATMCYICRQTVEDYSHFDGGGRRSGIKKCPLFSENEEIHVQKVQDAGRKIRDEELRNNPNLQLTYDPTNVRIYPKLFVTSFGSDSESSDTDISISESSISDSDTETYFDSDSEM